MPLSMVDCAKKTGREVARKETLDRVSRAI